MVYKPRKSHSIANELSCLPTSNEPSEMLDQVINAPLFLLQLTWLHEIHDYFQTRNFPILYTLKQ
jgi:hypothetical protein